MELDFNKLIADIARDEFTESVIELTKDNPAALAMFTMGRTVGRVDILSQLLAIIAKETSNLEALQKMLDKTQGKNGNTGTGRDE